MLHFCYYCVTNVCYPDGAGGPDSGGERIMKRTLSVKAIAAALILSLILPVMTVPADEAGADAQTDTAVNTAADTAPEKSKTIRNGYDEDGNFYDSKGYMIQKSTIRHLLEVALQPVGKTVYVWGGGWGGVPEATTVGVSPRWEQFFKQQTSSYDYRKTRYQAHDGLDCSGFVGWVMYNTFNTEDGHGSYVMLAQVMAKTFSNWGWGSYRTARKFKSQKPGDVMSLAAGHVYIVIGRCSDGSLVIVHSSPKGVMINGTVSRKGKKKSKAWKLAKKYMKKYYPEWYSKFKDVSRGMAYLKSYSKMSWYIDTPNSVMSDPEGLRGMNAAQVLKVIFHE